MHHPEPPGPVPARSDLRSMLRNHLARRATEALDAGAARRRALSNPEDVTRWSADIRAFVRDALRLSEIRSSPLNARTLSRHEREQYAVENVIFQSVDGWQVNATIFLPRRTREGPRRFPGVVVPCGHSSKAHPAHQLPCQVFARAGYVAITFDPPAQGGEKNEGNDHFTDGARCYAVGDASQRYFAADALRAMDYLETRDDVDAS